MNIDIDEFQALVNRHQEVLDGQKSEDELFDQAEALFPALIARYDAEENYDLAGIVRMLQAHAQMIRNASTNIKALASLLQAVASRMSPTQGDQAEKLQAMRREADDMEPGIEDARLAFSARLREQGEEDTAKVVDILLNEHKLFRIHEQRLRMIEARVSLGPAPDLPGTSEDRDSPKSD